MSDTRFSFLPHSLKRKQSIFESSKCVYHEKTLRESKENLHVFSLVLNLEYVYMLSLNTAKLLFISLDMTEDRKFKKYRST